MKLLNNKPFIDLSEYIDLESFDQLQPKIWRGLAKSKNLAQIGNLDISPNRLDLDGSEFEYLPLCSALEEFNLINNDHPIKLCSHDLSKDELATYLKFGLGGYDLYLTYQKFLFESYFPELLLWIKNLNIFDHVDDYYIMTMEAGGISFDHRHPPIDENDHKLISEFVHIRPNLDRPFYVRDTKTLEKHYINTKAAYWNDQGRHGGDPVMKTTYSLRIDGKFTEEFRNKILK